MARYIEESEVKRMIIRRGWMSEEELENSSVVADLPSAQQWIPVSERLPDLLDEGYLVSLSWGGVGVLEYKSTGFHDYESFSPVPIRIVTAWMPLPKPFRKGEEDEVN